MKWSTYILLIIMYVWVYIWNPFYILYIEVYGRIDSLLHDHSTDNHEFHDGMATMMATKQNSANQASFRNDIMLLSTLLFLSYGAD